jgi:hypothetical protein
MARSALPSKFESPLTVEGRRTSEGIEQRLKDLAAWLAPTVKISICVEKRGDGKKKKTAFGN